MPQPSDDEIRRRYGLPPGTRIVRLKPDALGRVRVEPDAFAYVEVESALEAARWDRPVAVAGTTVHLSVQGVMVGEDNPVRVTLRDSRDRVVGRGTGAMYRDRAVVAVEVDRRAAGRDPDGALCAADVELTALTLRAVSAPLLVLPFAELVRAEWGRAEARDGDDVALSCRVTGTPAGVARLARETAEVEVLRGDEGEGALFEPVATLRVPVTDGRIEARWRVGYDAEGKAQIATQAELDEVAERSGGAGGQYQRPAWRFRVRAGGLEAESGELGYRDHVDLAWGAGTGRPAGGAPVEVRLADGTVREGALGDDGRLRLGDVPPGPVTALFGPDPRPYEREPGVGSGWTEALPALDLPPDLAPAPALGAGSPLLAASASGLSAAALGPDLLASLAGADPDDGDDFVERLWGTVIGDFNEDADFDQIAANVGASLLPGVGQVVDLRDIAAGLYLLSKDEGWRDWLKWLGLVAALVGVVPGVGDLVKGAFRVTLRFMRDVPGQGAEAAVRALRGAFGRKRLSGDLVRWVDDLEVDRLVERATAALEWAGGYLRELFERAARQAERGAVQSAERVGRALSEVRLGTANVFRSLAGRAPAVAAPVASLAARLRATAGEVERLQAMGNERVVRGVRELYDGLREMVGLSPVPPARPRGRGVTGERIEAGEPSGGRPRPPGLEDGAVNRPYRANGLPEVAKVHPGWPDLPPGDATTFVRATPVELPPGTRIYRVIEDSRYPNGSFWAYELPGSRADWRNRFAVKDDWSQNGYYVEYEAPPVPPNSPLRVWSGPAAEQRANSPGWTLPGGGEQIWMPRGHVVPSSQRPTNW